MNQYWINISNGDEEAYSAFYVDYYARLYNYGRKLTEDIQTLEDAVQEILLSIWHNRLRLADISNPNAYYFASFRHLLFKKTRKTLVPVQEQAYEFSVDSIIIREELDSELKERLQNAVSQLTSRQAEAIYLRFYEGLSYEEVAAMLDISVKATYKIVARALLQLKTLLGPAYATLIFTPAFYRLFYPGL